MTQSFQNMILIVFLNLKNMTYQRAWDIFLEDLPQGQPGTGCCDEYRAALAACLVEPVLWLIGVWTVAPYVKAGVMGTLPPNPFDVSQRAYDCIRKADEQYKPRCSN